MTFTALASVDQICDALQQSPLFQLSLASKELFHSNFLAWLCETYPDHAGRLFATFLSRVPLTYEGLHVYRERRNIDMWLEYPGGGQLLIENKVKSLPVKAQLEEYAAAASNKALASFLLLSLTRPVFLPPGQRSVHLSNDVVWQYLTYHELAGKLHGLLPHIAAINSYHGQLLSDYIDFITHLDALQDRFAVDWDDQRANFFGARSDIQRLKRIRLHDLIDKIRYAQLEQRVADTLCHDGFPVVRGNLRDARDGQQGQVLVDSGMTRGVGLFDLKYFAMNKDRFGSPVVIGVQVQGNHFRLVVEVWNKSKAHKIAAALWHPGGSSRLWFDFGPLSGGSEEYPKKRVFNQYSGIFFYRSKRLDNISPKCLVDTIVAYARLARSNETTIRHQIEMAL